MLAIILSFIVAVLAGGVAVYFQGQSLWKALVYVSVLFGMLAVGMLTLPRLQARVEGVSIIQVPAQKTLLESDVRIERAAAKKREAELEAALVIARREAKNAMATPRELTLAEREAIGIAYMEQIAKNDAAIVAAEEIVILEEVLAIAEEACKNLDYKEAYSICEELKTTEGWPQNERLQSGVEKIEEAIKVYRIMNQKAQSEAAWKADIAAYQAARAAQREPRPRRQTAGIQDAKDNILSARSPERAAKQRMQEEREERRKRANERYFSRTNP